MESIAIGGGDTATPINLAKRIRLIQSMVDLRGKKVIDLGCGSGDYVDYFRRQMGAEAWGVEFQIDKVVAAKMNKNICDFILQGNIEKTALPDSSFDFVLLNEVLEHVPNDDAALREAFRILGQGGILCVFSPNRLFPFETHGCFLHSGKKVPPYIPFIPYLPSWLAKRTFRFWARNYWPWELNLKIQNAGFSIFQKTFVWQTFENISHAQPAFIQKFRKAFLFISFRCESIPLIRRFGASQVYFAVKPYEGKSSNP